MKMLIALLFASFVFLVRGDHGPNEIPEGYFECGHYHCRDDANATCQHGKCACPPHDIGNPRIQCAHPDEHCLCTVWGDPHISNFMDDKFTLPLPCTHMIADLTTPKTDDLPEGCQVVIVGLAHFPEHARNPLVSFESQIDILVLTQKSRYTARIIKGQDPETSFVPFKRGGEPDISVKMVREAGFYVFDISGCEITIKYNPHIGVLSLLTPVGSIDSAGLCGECDPNLSGSSNHLAPTPLEWLRLLINSLWQKSPLDYTDINVYPSCSELTDRVQTCKEERKDFALEFCGKMLIERPVTRCFARQYGAREVEIKFSDCYNSVCSGKKQCSEFEAVYNGCNVPGLDAFLNNGTFCEP